MLYFKHLWLVTSSCAAERTALNKLRSSQASGMGEDKVDQDTYIIMTQFHIFKSIYFCGPKIRKLSRTSVKTLCRHSTWQWRCIAQWRQGSGFTMQKWSTAPPPPPSTLNHRLDVFGMWSDVLKPKHDNCCFKKGQFLNLAHNPTIVQSAGCCLMRYQFLFHSKHLIVARCVINFCFILSTW